ncbi:MAG: sigma-70 family RNA polymerase sigma factor [Lysobacteraceae bacterium]
MSGDVTEMLQAWRGGDTDARNRLMSAVYDELRAIAARQFERERQDHTLQPTALVNEAYQRLIAIDRIDWQDRVHFIAVAARVMRQVLVDHARRRNAAKRDAAAQPVLTLTPGVRDHGVDAIDLDRALQRLEAIDPDKGRVIELRFYGGLTVEQTAEALGMSPATVKRHWQAARVWLYDALERGG